MSLTSGVSRSAAGHPWASVGSESDGLVYGSVSQALTSADVDVLVYTSATAVKEHAWSAVEAGVHLVIGSSGLTRPPTENSTGSRTTLVSG